MFDVHKSALDDSFDLAPPAGGYTLPTSYLSCSQIEMYLRCPRQYEFRYVKDMRRPPGVAMAFGTSAHKSVEITHHHIVDHGVPASDEQMLTTFVDTFKFTSLDIPEETWTEENVTPGALQDVGVRLMRLYNQKHASKVRPQVNDKQERGIEKRFETRICDVPIVGVIDLIDANADTTLLSAQERAICQTHNQPILDVMHTAVVDFKTKSKSFSKGDVDNSLQLTLYSYVENIPTVRFDQFLRLKTPTFRQIHSFRKHQDYQWLQQIVVGAAKAINAGIFPPCDPANWACSPKWCGYWDMCRGRKI